MSSKRRFTSIVLALLVCFTAAAVAKGPMPVEVRVEIAPAARNAWGPKATERVAGEAANKLVTCLEKAPQPLSFWNFVSGANRYTLLVRLVDARTAPEGAINLQISLLDGGHLLAPPWSKLLWKIGPQGGGYPNPKARAPEEISGQSCNLLISGEEEASVEKSFKSFVPLVGNLYWAKQTPNGIVLPLDYPKYDFLTGSRFHVQVSPSWPNPPLVVQSHGKTEPYPSDGYPALVVEPSQRVNPSYTLEFIFLDEYVYRATSGLAKQTLAPKGKS